jgi:amino acid transporter
MLPRLVSAQPEAAERETGLKQNAIGFLDALVIGLASTAPAYSLAAVIGIVVVIVGVQAPTVLLASFVPMFFIAAAFYYMNRADQDCGTTFSWVTRALGPWPGWLGGWAICTTGILVVGSLADVAALFIGAAFLALGVVLMVAWRIAGPRGYFERRGFEALPRDFTPGEPAPELAETPAGKS